MTLHRLIQIQGGQVRYVKSGQPHSADKHQLQGIINVLESIFDIFTVGRDGVHLCSMGSDIQSLLRKLIVFIGIFGDDNRHFHLAHIVKDSSQSVALFFCFCAISFFDNILLFDSPVVLNLIVHLYGSELIHRYDHCLAQETTSREVVRDVLCDFIKTVITLDNLQDTRSRVLKQSGLIFVEIFVFDNIDYIIIKEVILKTNGRHTSGIEQRNRRSFRNRLSEVVFGNVVTKPLIRQSLCTKQGSAGERNIVCIRQCRSHVLSQIFILSSVSLVNEHDNVVTSGKNGVLLALIITELVYKCEDKGLICLQELAELLAVFGLALLVRADNTGTNKVLMDLCIKVITVSDNQEGEVSMHLSLDLAGEHNHRVGFARALGVPEDTELTFKLLPVLH